MSNQTGQFWGDNAVQFPRLLAEVAATVELSDRQFSDIAASMDLAVSEVKELFDRAQHEFESIKQRVCVDSKANGIKAGETGAKNGIFKS